MRRCSRNWVHGLWHALSQIGYHMQLAVGIMDSIDIGQVRSLLSVQLARAWSYIAVNPRVCPSEGARLCTYLRWFSRPGGCKTELLRLPLPHKAMVKYPRFRTGCHGLPNIAGSWAGVPRSQRLCPLCQSQYADERHALLECSALTALRQRYGQLFSERNSMREFLWQNDMVQLARYVVECLKAFAAVQQ